MAKVTKYGQWQYPGEDTIIPTPDGRITMEGVPYPVLGVDNLGNQQMMMPGANYQFPGNFVYETPMSNNKISDPNVIAQLINNYKSNINSYRHGGNVAHKNLPKADYGMSASGCDPGYVWDSVLKRCVPKGPVIRNYNNSDFIRDQVFSGIQSLPPAKKKTTTKTTSTKKTTAPGLPRNPFPEGINDFKSYQKSEEIANWINNEYANSNDPKVLEKERQERFISNATKPKQEDIQYIDPDTGYAKSKFVGNDLAGVGLWSPDETIAAGITDADKQQHLATLYEIQQQQDKVNQLQFDAAFEKNKNNKQKLENQLKIENDILQEKEKNQYTTDFSNKVRNYKYGNKSIYDYDAAGLPSVPIFESAFLAPVALGEAGLAGLGDAFYGWASTNPYVQATIAGFGDAFTAAPSWAPGLNLGNAITAGDISYVGSQLLNPDSDARQAISVAIDDPNFNNIASAAGETGLLGADLLGAGLFKGGRELAKDAVNASSKLFKGSGDALLTLYDKLKETDFYKALSPAARRQLQLDIDSGKITAQDLFNELSLTDTKVSELDWDIKNKMRNPAFMSYLGKRRASLNLQSQGKGFMNSMLPLRRNTIEKASDYKLVDGKLVATEPSPFFAKDTHTGQSVVTTGQKQIIDLKTGNLVDASVEPSGSIKSFSLDESQKLPGQRGTLSKETVSTNTPNISQPYQETLKNNIAYVEETVPGAKVFGSSRGVAEGNLPHLSDDYDVFISESNYNKNVRDKFQKTDQKGSAQVHDISADGRGSKAGKNDPESAYNIDFNIIHENPDGTVKPVWQMGANGFEYSREIELFRQNFPEEFFEATQAAIKSGDPKNIKINKTADELINSFDPTVKTIMDAYESGKPKHVNRIDTYINFGDTNKVLEAQEKFAKSLVGKNGSIGKQFPESAFADVNKNKEILSKIGFIGDADRVATDPKRMQLAINDYYINNSILSRNVSAGGLEQRGIDAAEGFKSWYSKNPSGTIYGTGQNYVRLGASKHQEFPGDTITGFRQLGLDNNFDDPLEFVNSVFRQTDGNYIFNEDELKTVNSLIDKHFGEGVALDLEAGVKPITKSEDLILLNRISDPRLQPSNNDFTKHDEFLKDVSKNLGIKSITNKTDPQYGNSIYASTLANFDEYLDNLGFGYLGSNIPTDLKSYSQRLAGYEGRSANMKTINDIITSGEFKKVEGLIKGGLPKAKSRLAQLEQEAFEVERETQRLQSMYTAKDTARLEELKKQQDKIYKEWTDANSKVNDLQRLNWKLDNLRSTIINVSAATGVAGGLGATTYLLWDKMSQNRDEWQKNPPGNRKRMPLPGGGYMEEPTNKKFGGEIKFGPKPFIGYLPFTHYQLK